jgi:hypothetical protein
VVNKFLQGERADCPNFDKYVNETLLPLLAEYDPKDVYNGDETGLFYKVLPNRTYCFKDDDVGGWKKEKSRLTLFLVANMDGSHKLRPVVIGTAKKPQCLKRYNMGVADLPVMYFSNTKAWMSMNIYEQFMERWNRKLYYQKRHILLFLDNASGHSSATYSNIRVEFLPPNTTAKLQPMDQGIIASLKRRYRKVIAEEYLANLENGPDKYGHDAYHILKYYNVKQACDIIARAWRQMPESVIANSFKKAGFVAGPLTPLPPQEDVDPQVWSTVQRRFDTQVTFEEYAVCDSCVETSAAPLTDQEIVQTVQNTDMDLDGEDPDAENPDEPCIVNSCSYFLALIDQQRAYLSRNRLNQKLLDELENKLLEFRFCSARNKCQSATSSSRHLPVL